MNAENQKANCADSSSHEYRKSNRTNPCGHKKSNHRARKQDLRYISEVLREKPNLLLVQLHYLSYQHLHKCQPVPLQKSPSCVLVDGDKWFDLGFWLFS
mgnify:CR=1